MRRIRKSSLSRALPVLIMASVHHVATVKAGSLGRFSGEQPEWRSSPRQSDSPLDSSIPFMGCPTQKLYPSLRKSSPYPWPGQPFRAVASLGGSCVHTLTSFRKFCGEAVGSLRDSSLFEACVSVSSWALVFVLAIEVVKAVRDVQREFMEEASDLFDTSAARQGGGMSSRANAIMSPATAEKLVTWLNTADGSRASYPKAVPSWVVALAHDIKHYCAGVSDNDLSRILSHLSLPQAQFLQNCMLRPSGNVNFETLEGMEHIKGDILRWIQNNRMSLKHNRKEQPSSSSPYRRLLQGRQGMVMWGAPGCGKSTLIKAIADETRLPTLIVTPSLLQRKWFGESTNRVRMLFELISVLGPCVVVFDDLDGLFRMRGNDVENDASRELKTELLQWWDGVMSDQKSDSRVLLVGATNRPWDVDSAVWRRLPLRFYVGSPNWQERFRIWIRWLLDYKIPTEDKAVLGKFLADHTEGYTSSDLFQVLQTACQDGPMARENSNEAGDLQLTVTDIQQALQTVTPTLFPQQYLTQLRNFLSPQDLRRHQLSHSKTDRDTEDTAEDSHVWRTPAGNFYQFNIPVPPKVFDALQDLWLRYQDWESSSDDESFSDIDDDSDTDID